MQFKLASVSTTLQGNVTKTLKELHKSDIIRGSLMHILEELVQSRKYT